MTMVAIKKTGKCWERHYVSRDRLKGFLGWLSRKGIKYRIPSL